MSRAIELKEEIQEHLKQYYPDEDFSNLYETSKALLEISRDPDEEGDGGEEDDEVFDGSEYEEEEHAQPMDELDKIILMEERHHQMERVLQIQERELQILERELKKEEDNEVSDGAAHEEQVHAIAQEIERQIAERVLQIKEKQEIDALKQLA